MVVTPVRVLIVDDSVVMRRLISDALSADPDIEVVATASNGQIALAKLRTARVEAVVLDVEMPVMDGLETVRAIRKIDRRLPVIMFSTLTELGARATLDALAAGASDYVTKPANVGSVTASLNAVRSELVPRIVALARRQSGPAPTPNPPAVRRPTATPTGTAAGTPPGTPAGAPHATPSARPMRSPAGAARASLAGPLAPPSLRPARAAATRPHILVIGSSTGGPEALMKVLPGLPANLPVPVLIAQHMPPVFTRMLAERLERSCALSVREAAGGEPLAPGGVYLAPGDWHLEVTSGTNASRKYVSTLTKAPPENFCRPSVDVLFRSAAKAYGAAVLAVVLTGMGSDGCVGAQAIVDAGGVVLIQDRESSVVWGMPGAVANKGLASEVLPVENISSAIVRRLSASRA